MSIRPLFLDTSIQIARLIHSPAMKRRIEERLRHYDETITGPVVRQEIKRRLLKEAKYLLGLLEELGSATAVRRHLVDTLPHQQGRKRNICDQLLVTVDEQDTEEDMTERVRLYLTRLLRDGLEAIDFKVTRSVEGSGCACAAQPVKLRSRRNKADTYEFGSDYCSRIPEGKCGIVAFLRENRDAAQAILRHLSALAGDEKTEELKRTEEFLLAVIGTEENAIARDPCLKVGDLLIALESVGVGHFYTLNRAESIHLCRALGQTLLVRPKNTTLEDEEHPGKPIAPQASGEPAPSPARPSTA